MQVLLKIYLGLVQDVFMVGPWFVYVLFRDYLGFVYGFFMGGFGCIWWWFRRKLFEVGLKFICVSLNLL